MEADVSVHKLYHFKNAETERGKLESVIVLCGKSGQYYGKLIPITKVCPLQNLQGMVLLCQLQQKIQDGF